MTEKQIRDYSNNATHLSEDKKDSLYEALMAANDDAEREVIKGKYNPSYTVSKDNSNVETPSYALSTDPKDPGYWMNMDSRQLQELAMKDPWAGVMNPDSSLNSQKYGEWLNRLAAESNAKIKKNIANGDYEGAHWLEKLGALAGETFMPRMHEAYERGEEPGIRDYALDAVQNAAYALPVGMYAGALTRNLPWLVKLGAVEGSNFAVPFAMEGLDRLVYAGDESTDRSTFSLNDALVGGAVNMGTPMVIRGAGMGLGRAANGMAGSAAGYAEDIAGALRNFGVDPKDKAIETIMKAENTLNAKRVPVRNLEGGEELPWVNTGALKKGEPLMDVMDALNTRQVGKGIEDGTISFVPGNSSRPTVSADNYLLSEDGRILRTDLDGANSEPWWYKNDEKGAVLSDYVMRDGKPMYMGPEATTADIQWKKAGDYTSPTKRGTNTQDTRAAIGNVIENHPELLGARATKIQRHAAQAPMNYTTNMLGKSEYAKKAETAVPILSKAIEKSAKNEKEARWKAGKVSFDEQHSKEYQDWWVRQQLGIE